MEDPVLEFVELRPPYHKSVQENYRNSIKTESWLNANFMVPDDKNNTAGTTYDISRLLVLQLYI